MAVLYYRVCDVPTHYRRAAEDALWDACKTLELSVVARPIAVRFFVRECDVRQAMLDNLSAPRGAITDLPCFSIEHKHGERGELNGLAINWPDRAEVRLSANLTLRELRGVVAHEARHVAEYVRGEDAGEDHKHIFEDWQRSEDRADQFRATKLREYNRQHPPIVLKKA